jgi:hypothetical protein
VLQSPKGSYLSQYKYIQDALCQNDVPPIQEPSEYWHIVGSLVYLTITRPNIAHALQFIMVTCLICCVTYEEQHPNAYSILGIVLFSFSLILMPLGLVTQLSVAQLLVVVFFLDPLLLHGNLRSKQ